MPKPRLRKRHRVRSDLSDRADPPNSTRERPGTPGPFAFRATLKNSALPRAMEGAPADHARTCLIQRDRAKRRRRRVAAERVRTCAGLATTDQGQEGLDQCFLKWLCVPGTCCTPRRARPRPERAPAQATERRKGQTAELKPASARLPDTSSSPTLGRERPRAARPALLDGDLLRDCPDARLNSRWDPPVRAAERSAPARPHRARRACRTRGTCGWRRSSRSG